MDFKLDLAIKNGSFEISIAIFNENSPIMFLTDSPNTKLDLTMEPKKRAQQITEYLKGLNPVGLIGSLEIQRYYSAGVRINGETQFGVDAIANLLSRHLPIKTEEVEKLITKRFEQGYKQLIFVTKANAYGVKEMDANEWLALAELPDEDTRLDRFNKLLKKNGSRFRCFTSKTYVVRTYGT